MGVSVTPSKLWLHVSAFVTGAVCIVLWGGMVMRQEWFERRNRRG